MMVAPSSSSPPPCRGRQSLGWMIVLSALTVMALMWCSPHSNGVSAKKTEVETEEDSSGSGTDPERVRELMYKRRYGIKLTRNEVKELKIAEQKKYKELRKNFDDVSNTLESAMLRHYRLRHLKRKGLWRKRERSLAEVFFSGESPRDYSPGEDMEILVDLVESKRTQMPLAFYDLPTMCAASPGNEESIIADARQRQQPQWNNIASRLQGHRQLMPSPFRNIHAKQNVPCTLLCVVNVQGETLQQLRRLVDGQYRVQLTLDQMPVLRRSKEFNYVARGYPIGFKAPSQGSDSPKIGFYLFNHLKFTIYYEDNPEDNTLRITGFDVHPVSIKHDIPMDLNAVGGEDTVKMLNEATKWSTCNVNVINDPSTYLKMDSGITGPMSFAYSYEVEWQKTKITWADRWDVYFIGSPEANEIHYFSFVNSLMIGVVLTGAISTIMIRYLRADIARCYEKQTLEKDQDMRQKLLGETQEETGWKSLHGDVFRPPQFSPMLLCALVGTGTHIGVAFMCAMCGMLGAIFGLFRSMNKGQMLAAIIVSYVLTGSIAGYISARLVQFCTTKAWIQTTLLTSTLLPGLIVAMFSNLSMLLSTVHAATAVSFSTLLDLLLLWTCALAPLVFLGSYFGLRANKIHVPTKTNEFTRVTPDLPLYLHSFVTMLMGGILPFGCVWVELDHFMSALWLRQIYCVTGFLLAVVFVLGATCAQVSMVLCYLQLCAEDHRWWWKSFWNCASSGVYLFLYSLWYMSTRLDFMGVLPVVLFLTYMAMISVCFGVFCGAIGVLSNFWFTRTIYDAVKFESAE